MDLLLGLLLALGGLGAPALPPQTKEPPAPAPAQLRMADEVDPGFTHREKPPIAKGRMTGFYFKAEWPIIPDGQGEQAESHERGGVKGDAPDSMKAPAAKQDESDNEKAVYRVLALRR